ncbi:MAG: hypothetical protein COU35_01065 [Candidatus Magasanikbacteria bacterium CG10_big_fil_rev_8_21_14_0_10_47_10]|uniref:PDZ domain-containing protein n=1 Tax=Candidatus Magasanikbacteria bacterium CG10_big_fil_rev_8_21_14_0_10_47_10 TaxID=1974652 RepID=A0A2H0TRG3_9BACT|nr:MAG: hypothetical protein COU35_01065 [Candidatus Magasanikbacteria bacterium CG10_big_fil_rev_8_21_14_0_10_47_10]
MLEKNKKILPLAIAAALVFTFALGFFGGSSYSVSSKITNESGQVEIARVIDLYSKTRSEEVSFDQFWNVWDMIHKNYVDQPVDDVTLFYGAIEGLVQGLGDPHSVYFPPTDAKEFADNLAGEFEGIGAEIGIRDEQLQVIAPLPDSPAQKAGLRPGDNIYAIDGEETQGLTVEKAVTKIRGPRGTEVVLTVSHDGFDAIEEVSIVRETIAIPTVILEDEGDGIVYLRISHFNDDTFGDFNAMVKEIVSKDPKGIVLDLRSNPGGFLDSAVKVASEWVTDGLILKERFQDGDVQEYPTRGAHRLAGIPTVILIDEGTASGSEILAGALQDHGLATVIGRTSYGKGSVQNFEVLPDGSAIKLTIAKWLTPKERQIDGEGIAPDIDIEEMFVEDETAEDGVRDIGRERAVHILLGIDVTPDVAAADEN